MLVECRTGEAGAGREELLAGFQAVVDCTGTYGHQCWLGEDGLPALGERRLSNTEEGTTVAVSGPSSFVLDQSVQHKLFSF